MISQVPKRPEALPGFDEVQTAPNTEISHGRSIINLFVEFAAANRQIEDTFRSTPGAQ
jgi:hypothetical protein